jgi:hypothetical protein
MSEKKKLNSDLSIEELLKALNGDSDEDADNADEIISSNPVFAFIQTFEIKEGKHRVSCSLMYDLFKQWDKFSSLNNVQFFTEFQKYFRVENIASRYHRNRFYLVNKDLFEIVKHVETYKRPQFIDNIRFKAYKKHIESFFEQKDIKPGDLYIESDVFYHIYDTWVYKKEIKRQLSHRHFSAVCKLYFTNKRFKGSDMEWFGVDSNIKQHISAQGVANWRQGRSKRGKRSKVQEKDKNSIIYPETQEQEESS